MVLGEPIYLLLSVFCISNVSPFQLFLILNCFSVEVYYPGLPPPVAVGQSVWSAREGAQDPSGRELFLLSFVSPHSVSRCLVRTRVPWATCRHLGSTYS